MIRRVIKTTFFGVLLLCSFGLSTAKDINSSDAPTAAFESSETYVPNEIIIKLRPGVADKINQQLTSGTALKDVWPGSLKRLNDKYKHLNTHPLVGGFDKNEQQIKDLAGKDVSQLNPRERHIAARARRAPRGAVVPNLGNIYKIQFNLDSNDSLQEIVKAYREDPSVEYAELNHIIHIDVSPSDPLYPIQWALPKIDAPQAWDINIGSGSTIVAVADTGVDYNHRDINDNIWTDPNGYHGHDYVNSDNDPIDDHGHGTHCAGTIAAKGNNEMDIAGVCWNAGIMGLKILDSDGHGQTTNAIPAFYYAVQNGADVISNSWGGGSFSQALQDAIDYAYSQGVVIVASAGNDNSSSPQYPANYNHVISVAATDSDDQRASFSNYGSWVDIAAPGVDILSLRATGTSMGSPYDAYTTYASGTSMSCPHVSGACALLISKNPTLTVDEIEEILCAETDPIPAGICRSNGRLNIYKAITPSSGRIYFDRVLYSCTDEIGLKLVDLDLKGENARSVTVYTESDTETVLLNNENGSFIFTGAIFTAAGTPNIGDGILQVSDGQSIYVTYEDADNGFGETETVTETASVDCHGPDIFNIQITDITSISAVVTFQTNENSTSKLYYGLNCNAPGLLEDTVLKTSHSFTIFGLGPLTTYYFKIEARDALGNISTDNNNGLCYRFTTAREPGYIYVPTNYPTIQQAINDAVTGDTIIVKDGTYTGANNRDIGFGGKMITLKSENGPENCIIDCQGAVNDQHCGFCFAGGENQYTVVDGFTIKNGHINTEGGGIQCLHSNPTIKNCIIKNNSSGDRYDYYNSGGGGIYCHNSNAIFMYCIISDNYTHNWGGGIYCYDGGTVKILNCVFTGNRADYVSDMGTWSYGGGIACYMANAEIKNCLVANNWVHEFAGGICFNRSTSSVSNCTIAYNQAGQRTGGVYQYLSTVSIDNSIIWGNTDPSSEQIRGSFAISYCDIQGGYAGSGNINANPYFVSGHKGNYYLSQTAAGQAMNSPCADAGSDAAVTLKMNLQTTRTDEIDDARIVDMGYHYNCILTVNPDLNGDTFVDFIDYALMARNWQQSPDPCDPNNGDITRDGWVDFIDLAELASNWLTCFVTRAANPQPADRSSDTGKYAILQWSPGKWCTSHNIYIGTDFNEVANADITSSSVYMGNQDVNFWDINNFYLNGLAPNTTYYWRIDEIGLACSAEGDIWSFTTCSEPNLNYGLVAWWKFDEGSGLTAYDSAGNNNGILCGAPDWITGKVGDYALDFNGTGDFVEVNDNPSLDIDSAITISAWVKLNNRFMGYYIVTKQPTIDVPGWPGNYMFYIQPSSVGKLVFSHETGLGELPPSYLSNSSISKGIWHHVAVTLGNGQVSFYIDGASAGTFAQSGNFGLVNNEPVRIGTRDDYTSYFNGSIDDVRIYNRVLTADEIALLYGQ